VIIAIICGYLMMSKKLSLYYHWDAGPYLLKFNTVFSDAELGETYLRIKRQVDSFSYKSEDLNGAPVLNSMMALLRYISITHCIYIPIKMMRFPL